MQKFNEELLEKMTDNEEWRKSVMNEIKAKAVGTEGAPKTIEIKEVEEIFDKSKDRINSELLNKILSVMNSDSDSDKLWSMKDILVNMQRNGERYNFSINTLKLHLEFMVKDNALLRVLSSGGVLYKINPQI